MSYLLKVKIYKTFYKDSQAQLWFFYPIYKKAGNLIFTFNLILFDIDMCQEILSILLMLMN